MSPSITIYSHDATSGKTKTPDDQSDFLCKGHLYATPMFGGDVTQMHRQGDLVPLRAWWVPTFLNSKSETSPKRPGRTAPSHVPGLAEVYLAQIPDYWREEGTDDPTNECRAIAARVLIDLYYQLGLTAKRVRASRVGGILLAFRSDDGTTRLEIEIDNDQEAVGGISTKNEILATKAMDSRDEWIELGREFRSRTS